MTANALPDPGRSEENPHLSGLSEAEALDRLHADGPNELPRERRRTLPRIALDVIREPMLALLIGAGGIYLALGDLHEALILVAFAGLSILITIVQESRTERALEALRDLSSPRALVIRDGVRRRIAGRDVVREDLVVLTEGDRVPADGLIIQNDCLQLDESLLTGESVPVRKTACRPAGHAGMLRPGGDDLPFVYSGSLVVSGTGIFSVVATGAASEIGRIGQVLSKLRTEVPRLRQQTRRLVFWFAIVGAVASLLAILLYGLSRGSWLEAMLAGIALGMSMLPEEFPVVLTIFMAMGAMRMSRERVLTRKATAIETLGSATVLCTDKTGTLTQNRMRIAQLRLPDGRILAHDDTSDFKLEGDFHTLAEIGILASAEEAIDPMEVAFHELGNKHARGSIKARQESGWTLQRHYPLEPALLAMSNTWKKRQAGDDMIVATKGAPEAIADLCGMTGAARERLNSMIDAMAESGLRVLGVARSRWSGSSLPASQKDFAFTFCGLVGLADPLRPSVPNAVNQCREAGIRVVMITGDYPLTACAIARQAGIDADNVLTGEELAAMSDSELRRRIATVSICARIMPEQKLRLVEALKASGEVVAMTGDGVNDAPSLKAAHIGIAMGGRGTDVAREASAIVLLDDDFGSIVKAVRMGRRIYDNLRKAMGFIVAVHIPIAGLALLPLLTGMPLLIGPIHIAFIEMIVDPVCSLVFEAEVDERNVMRRPPRHARTRLFSRGLLGWATLQGCVVLTVVAGLTTYFWKSSIHPDQLRAAAFLSLVLGIVSLILINRRFSASMLSALRERNRALATVLGLVTLILAVTQFVQPVADLFSFGRMSGQELLTIFLSSVAGFILLERMKRIWHTRLLE